MRGIVGFGDGRSYGSRGEAVISNMTRCAAGVCLSLLMHCAQSPPTSDPAAAAPAVEPCTPATPPPAEAAEKPRITQLPGVTVNLTERYAQMEGKVCLREGMLELIATVPAGKEHESIVSLTTRPSNLHAALLMLGLKPGKPGQWIYHPDRVEAIDPTGDLVRVSILWQEGDRWVEKPINELVLDRSGQGHMPANRFVFAGSHLLKTQSGDPLYVADQSGDIIALVSFGTEVLAWPKAASDSNETLAWRADPKAVPELGTAVKVRVYPAESPKTQVQGPESRGARP